MKQFLRNYNHKCNTVKPTLSELTGLNTSRIRKFDLKTLIKLIILYKLSITREIKKYLQAVYLLFIFITVFRDFMMYTANVFFFKLQTMESR